jgi:hypothetical protein
MSHAFMDGNKALPMDGIKIGNKQQFSNLTGQVEMQNIQQ